MGTLAVQVGNAGETQNADLPARAGRQSWQVQAISK